MKLHGAARGFTLLEVMISTAILALGLSAVFGSSILAARGTAHSRMVTNAALMSQCRMTEVEAYLRINQLPETDQNLDDPPEMGAEPCCTLPFTCLARVERIELPQPADLGTSAGDRLLSTAAGAASGSSFGGIGSSDGGVGAIGQLASAFGALGAGPGAGLGAMLGGGGSMSGSGAPDMQSMAAQLLGGIYPTIKPLLEGAIRKVTVTMSWNEGSRTFTFDVVQYVTNPGQTMQHGDSLNAIDRMLGGGTGSMGSGATMPGTGLPGTIFTPSGQSGASAPAANAGAR